MESAKEKKPMTTNQVVEIQDDYTHFSSKVEYIYENVLCDYEECSNADKDEYLTLKENYNTLLLNTCKGCRGPMMCHNCHFGPNYRYSATARELLLVTYREHTLIYECSAMCGCNPEQCHNRVVQFGPRKNLQVKFSMKYRSFGVFTNRPIPANAFICEYVGELLTQSIARRRVNANYKKKMMNYLVCLQETPIEPLNTGEAEPRPKYLTYLDPSRRGNVARYINHSCDPNCQTYSVRVDSPIPRIALFSKRYISSGEELSFHYNEGLPKRYANKGCAYTRIPCLCGASNCEKFMPNFDFFLD